ncbi:MAG TPA: sulfotransferase [Gemmata sp.]|jgi:hypothetical protein|nr:sulfotransferase [Gemmata sp.]
MDKHSYSLDDPHDRYHNRKPDFLVISPPKTGSTWLAANLRQHPQLFIPELKEIRYFNSLFKWLDYGWYCAHFDQAGARRAGEASPSYAALPLDSIQHLYRLFPDVKLVYLMRDPISRAWSHAKHNQKYREANFFATEPGSDPMAVTDDQWRANFYNDWPLTSGDYLGQLRRWMSVFPRTQLYVGFYESIVTRPAALLRDIFQFLEVDPAIDLSGFPVGEHFLSGSKMVLSPTLASTLRALLGSRTEELIGFLKDNLELEPPPKWQTTLEKSANTESVPSEAFQREADDSHLAKVMAMEETFHSAFRFIEEYRGYNIVFYRGQLYALARTVEPSAIATMDGSMLQRLQTEGTCLIGRTRAELKEQITTHLLEQAHSRFLVVEEQLQLAREAISRVAQQAHKATGRVAVGLSAVIARLQRPSRTQRLLRALSGVRSP